MKPGSFRTIAPLTATALVLVALTACGGNSASTKVTPSTSLTTAGATTISATKKLSALTVGADSTLAAPEGSSLTLTVDGIETPIVAGTTYTGSSSTGVVLEVTDEIPVLYAANFPVVGEVDFNYKWRTGIYVSDGSPVLSKSVTSAVQNLTLTEALTSLNSPKITSVGPAFNGIVVTASAANMDAFVIKEPVISLTGNGGDGSSYAYPGMTGTPSDAAKTWALQGNDFSGWGAGLVVQGYANVVLSNPSIYTKGVVRTAVLVKEYGSLTVNGGVIEAHDGTLPTDYDYLLNETGVLAQPWLVRGGYMSAVPWMLGLKGNCRATNLLDHGTAIYNGTRISAENWAALSVDNNNGVSLMANGCDIDVKGSGYASYSIGGGTSVYFSNCNVNIPDDLYILANGSPSATFSGGKATSGRFATMSHSNSSGIVEINNGAIITTAKALFLLKSAATSFVVDNATLTSTNGHILETAFNDDTGAGGFTGTQASKAVFTNTALTGSIYNGNPYHQLSVTIGAGGSLTGAITLATYKSDASIDGVSLVDYNLMASTNFRYMGAFTFTANPLDKSVYTDAAGYLNLTLADGGVWTLTGDSYISSLTVDGSSSLKAASAITVTEYTSTGAVATTAAAYSGGSLVPKATGNYFKLTIAS